MKLDIKDDKNDKELEMNVTTQIDLEEVTQKTYTDSNTFQTITDPFRYNTTFFNNITENVKEVSENLTETGMLVNKYSLNIGYILYYTYSICIYIYIG